MPATAADIKFFAAATMTDSADGGGPRAAAVVQNGVLSNVFPSISAAARGTGQVALRKVYPSLTNTDTAPLLGAALALNEVPSDTAVSVWTFRFGGALTTRAQAEAGLLAWHGQPGSSVAIRLAEWSSTLAKVRTPTAALPPELAVGQTLAFYESTPGKRLAEATITGIGDAVGFGSPVVTYWERDVALGGFRGVPSATVGRVYIGAPLAGPETLVYGACAVPGSLSSGATDVAVTSISTRIAPYTGSGAYPTANQGLNPGPLAYADGRLPVLRQGDAVTLWHEAATSPVMAVNGTPIPTGRTDPDQLAIVGNDGLEIVRFLAGGPVPSPAVATVDLAAGTVTPTNVTGWQQPVTVRHRISHRSTVATLSGTTATLADALTRAFPAGSVLSSHLPLGDVQARALGVFAQQAWTRVWSDSLIGNPAPLMYSGLPVVTNAGAETDRYAAVFTSATAYDVFSERLGKLGSGTTGSAFSPINAATGAALFTLVAANWAAEIAVGSVLRWNVEAASAPVWIGRTVVPSSPAGTVTANVRLHGSVD